MLQLTFNPGLTLTGFRTTQPWCPWLLVQEFISAEMAVGINVEIRKYESTEHSISPVTIK